MLSGGQIHTFVADARKYLAPLLECIIQARPNRTHDTLLQFGPSTRSGALRARRWSCHRCHQGRRRHADQEFSAFHVANYTGVVRFCRQKSTNGPALQVGKIQRREVVVDCFRAPDLHDGAVRAQQ